MQSALLILIIFHLECFVKFEFALLFLLRLFTSLSFFFFISSFRFIFLFFCLFHVRLPISTGKSNVIFNEDLPKNKAHDTSNDYS